jgi:hypothetical protein
MPHLPCKHQLLPWSEQDSGEVGQWAPSLHKLDLPLISSSAVSSKRWSTADSPLARNAPQSRSTHWSACSRTWVAHDELSPTQVQQQPTGTAHKHIIVRSGSNRFPISTQ